MAKETLSYLVYQLLKKHDISIDSEELEFQIKTHPTYPSLHAITGVLNHFNIENIAVEVPVDIDTLNSLPNGFLAQVNIDNHQQFAVVTKINDKLELVINTNTKKTVSQSEFLNQFTGIVLAVEKDETITNTESQPDKHNNIVTASALIAFALLLLSVFNANQSLSHVIFFGLSLIGIYISYTIVKQENGETTTLGDAFCSNPTEKKNCNAVLSSKGATINKYLKISDLSLIYFLGSALSIYMLILNSMSVFPILVISLTALPIVIYSIYYQAFVIKKWCALCLSIVAVLCIQAVLAFINFSPIFNGQSLLLVGLSFTTSVALWLWLSQMIKTNTELKDIKLKYFRFKRNFELFNTQLTESPVVDTHIDKIDEIVFGNPESSLHITVITNPFCGHCKPVHQLIENILTQNKDTVKITIRFNVNTSNLNNAAAKVTLRLLELYDTDTSDTCLNAMHDIYNNLTADQWLKKWKTCSNVDTYKSVLYAENQWCIKNNITFTPELLINGRSYPKAYDREDLIYFIEDLEEETHKQIIPKTQNEVIQN